MSNLIFIKTRRYSTLLKRIFEEYNENIEIYYESYRYTEKDIPEILKDWCSNSILKKTIDFKLIQNGKELFGFHDTPDNFWAAISERPFIERLAKEKVIRYRICSCEPKVSFGKSLCRYLKNLFLPNR
ncbi:MAG: hypothetical protein ACYS1A_14410 [Planctomycetota bacterium]|jgi:hypothetical protein